MCVLRTGVKNDRLYASELFVGFRHIALVLEVFYATDAAQNKRRLLCFREINRQAVVYRYFDARFVRKDLTDRFLALTNGESLFLRAVTSYTDDDFIKNLLL